MADRKAAMDALQQRFYDVMPYVVTGQFLAPKAWRDNVTGVVNASIADVAGLSDSRYRLARDAGGYTLTRLNDGTVFNLANAALTAAASKGVSLTKKSQAPCLIASTASLTSPWPVSMRTSTSG